MSARTTFKLSNGKSVSASVGHIDESGGIWPEMIHLWWLHSARGKAARSALTGEGD